MVDQETQARLDKLQRLEDAARARSKKWMEKTKASGKRQISAIVTGRVHDEICRRRDASTQTGKTLSTGEIIEQALFSDINIDSNINSDINFNEPPQGGATSKPVEQLAAEESPQVGEAADQELDIFGNPQPTLNIPDRADKVEYKAFLSGVFLELDSQDGTWKEKAGWLNERGILTVMGKTWNGNNAYTTAKKFNEERLQKINRRGLTDQYM